MKISEKHENALYYIKVSKNKLKEYKNKNIVGYYWPRSIKNRYIDFKPYLQYTISPYPESY